MKLLTRIGIVSLSLVLMQCEKDDICAESTPTTPSLIIRFYDFYNPSELKAAEDLNVFGIDNSGNTFDIIGQTTLTTDSLALPLPTNLNAASFRLYLGYLDEETIGNGDDLLTEFQTEDLFVSRACGFKTFYSELSMETQTDSDNWILSTEVIYTEINNTIHAHVKIYH